MLDPIDEISARLSMLEFVLEVVMANQLREVSPEVSAQVKADLVRVVKRAYGPMTADPDKARQMAALVERSVEMTERFVEKLSRREAEIRARTSRDQ